MMIWTFVLVILGFAAFCGYCGLGAWALVTVFGLVEVPGEEALNWRRGCAIVGAFLVLTALGIMGINSALEGSCPDGTTREYKSTGPKSGYHYCLARERL